MRYKILLQVLVLAGCWQLASGQVGASTFAFGALGKDSVGKSTRLGATTLPQCQPRSFSCSQAFTYTFTGTGNWTLPTNWEGNAIPPASLPQGATIIINPVTGGECVLNTTQTILNNASILVKAGKKLKLLNHLTIQH